MRRLSKFQAIQMGSEYFGLMREANSAQSATRPALARDFRTRAEIIKNALTAHGWRILPDGINVERVK